MWNSEQSSWNYSTSDILSDFVTVYAIPEGILLPLITWKQMILHKAFFYYHLIINQNE